MKLGCIGVGVRCNEVLRGNVSPYFSKGEVFLGSVRTFSTACQVFIFNKNKIFLKNFFKFYLF